MQIQQSLVGMGAIHDANEQQTLLRASSTLSASVVSEEANQTSGSNTAAMSTATQVQLSPNARRVTGRRSDQTHQSSHYGRHRTWPDRQNHSRNGYQTALCHH